MQRKFILHNLTCMLILLPKYDDEIYSHYNYIYYRHLVKFIDLLMLIKPLVSCLSQAVDLVILYVQHKIEIV